MPPFAGASRGKPVAHICAEVPLVDCESLGESRRVAMNRRDAASRGPGLIKISFLARAGGEVTDVAKVEREKIGNRTATGRLNIVV